MFLKLYTKLQSVRAEREQGATMVEYGLMVALIAVIVAVGAAILGGGINQLFQDVNAQLP